MRQNVSTDPCNRVSVITVVWNDTSGLQKTIESVIGQNYENLEFIIIDGASTDETIDVIKKYENKIAYWVSEEDDGIYDAMNKGIKASTGTWLNFMNAGDTFVDNNVFAKINFQEYKNTTLIYGNKVQNGKIMYPSNIENLQIGEIMACHQSMFFNKDKLGNELYYDLRYKIYADYELVNKIYLMFHNSIQYIDIVIADYESGGISLLPSTQKRKDKYLILYKYYGLFGLIKGIIYRILK